MRVVSFKVDEDLLEMLEELARRKRTSKSELIRAALRAYIMDTAEKRPVITKRIRIYG
ncbi:MAG: ribbon-helix-helix protein, CopG family [Desulfurococcales archaeon]|nr:ribbon-helix-helix protein, CopG family [Desulfurococcales archaeon]